MALLLTLLLTAQSLSAPGVSGVVRDSTGQVIAEPEFYQHAKGMAGAWTFGAADNSMLVRSASLALDYLKDNQATAQGGRTGWEKE